MNFVSLSLWGIDVSHEKQLVIIVLVLLAGTGGGVKLTMNDV